MSKQTEFNLDKGSWGGRRKNSGRKRLHSSGVSHEPRKGVTKHAPIHINIRYAIPVRNASGYEAFKKAISNLRKNLQVLHYSIESNHIHILIEAQDKRTLETGMRSFTRTFVRKMGKGSIQAGRYHHHVLRTPTEVYNAIRYVLLNHCHHTNSASIRSDQFNSLYSLDPKIVAKAFKVSISKSVLRNPIELDTPSSWLAKSFTPDKH